MEKVSDFRTTKAVAISHIGNDGLAEMESSFYQVRGEAVLVITR